MRKATSSPVSATPATGCSAPASGREARLPAHRVVPDGPALKCEGCIARGDAPCFVRTWSGGVGRSAEPLSRAVALLTGRVEHPLLAPEVRDLGGDPVEPRRR